MSIFCQTNHRTCQFDCLSLLYHCNFEHPWVLCCFDVSFVILYAWNMLSLTNYTWQDKFSNEGNDSIPCGFLIPRIHHEELSFTVLATFRVRHLLDPLYKQLKGCWKQGRFEEKMVPLDLFKDHRAAIAAWMWKMVVHYLTSYLLIYCI